MKHIIKNIFSSIGYEIKKLPRQQDAGSYRRPVGNMQFLLEDLKKRGLKCQTILDVGAHSGSWSRLAKKIFPSARFCLIEPQIEMKDELENFCRESDNSVYFIAGAGKESAVMTLITGDDLSGSSFFTKIDDKLKDSQHSREVKIITIDELITASKIKLPELIKLDIQGFELEALKGASKTFGYTEAYVMEVSFFPFSDVPGIPLIADVINFMLERAYVVYDFPGFARRPLDGALAQCDICFVKKDGLFRTSDEWG